MLAKHQEETSWLATRHLVPRCYYADKSQLSPALSSSVQLSPAQSSSVLHCFVLCLTFVLNLMYFMCVFNINLCFSPYCLGYSYIFITVSHFISSWKKNKRFTLEINSDIRDFYVRDHYIGRSN